MSELQQVSIGRDKAIAMAHSQWWKCDGLTPRDVFRVQIQTRELCMDFSAFHEAAEKALGRPVWTHEFARPQKLWDELNGDTTVTDPLTHSLTTLQEIMASIPAPPETEEE